MLKTLKRIFRIGGPKVISAYEGEKRLKNMKARIEADKLRKHGK